MTPKSIGCDRGADARFARKSSSLAARRGVDASCLKDADVIPESGVLDSVAILELIMWLEMTFDITIAQSDLTVENFGTIDAISQLSAASIAPFLMGTLLRCRTTDALQLRSSGAHGVPHAETHAWPSR